MQNKGVWIWRGILALLLGASTVMTILGAIGTACLAWNGNLYPPKVFGWIVPHMPTYQLLVYIGLAAGVALAVVTYALLRGDRWFYIGALIFLLIGGGAAAYQMYLTSSLKNISFFAAAPTNVRFYITALTLLVLLIVRIPGVWNKSGLGKRGGGKGNFGAPTGMALMLTGFLLITAPTWAAPEHIVDGFNYVTTLQLPLVVDGLALMIGGAGLLLARRVREQWVVSRG
ncbi:MAG: hypothetical protein L0Y55_16865 [Anaerolineales bacterium]|nr:hypothetical protein [Anaerolineales bacterium]